MRWKVTTCRCQIDYILSRPSFDNFNGASAPVPYAIIEKCDDHVAAGTAEALDAMVGPENEAMARAYAIMLDTGAAYGGERLPVFYNYGIVSWGFNAERKLEMTVDLADAQRMEWLSTVDNLLVTYDTEGVNGVREPNEVLPTSRSGERRIVQGARQDVNTEHHALHEEWRSYFNVVGGGALRVTDTQQINVDFGVDAALKASQHILDFDGSVDMFSVRVDGNHRDRAVQYRIRINDIDTNQWVTVPPFRMGIFTCMGAYNPDDQSEATFVVGESIVGYASSQEITVFPIGDFAFEGRCNTRMTTCEILCDVRRHSVYSAREPAYIDNEGAAPPAYSSYPIAGSLVHYRSEITKKTSVVDGAEAEAPVDWLVRSAGQLTHLQTGWEPTMGAALIGLRVNFKPVSNWEVGPIPEEPDVPPYPSIPLTAEAPVPWFKYRVDEEHYADIESGDIVATVGFHQPVGEGATTVYGVGVNWEAAAGVRTVDMIVQQAALDSRDVDPEQLRVNNFNYVFGAGGPEGFDREWFASAIGNFHPRTREQLEAMPLHWNDIELFATFDVQLSRIRGYVDEPVSLTNDHTLRLGMAIGHGGVGDLAADLGSTAHRVGETEWFEDEAHTDEVIAGRGFCLRLVAETTSENTVAQVSMVCYSYREAPPNRECLVRVLPDAEAVEALPCGTRLVRCVKITREDEQVFAYTEHDRTITYDGTDYLACGGFEGSASETGAVSGEVGNMEIRGFASTLGITRADLFAGKFDGAAVEVWLLPWGDDYDVQPARQIGGGTIGKVTQDGQAFTMEALSASAYLKQRALLEVVTPTCRYELGETRCAVAVESMRVTGSVTAVDATAVDVGDLTSRREFTDSARDEEDGWFDEGYITWTTGDNAGSVSHVKSFVGGLFVLWEALNYVISTTDEYTAIPGCDKRAATCTAKFDNLVNFGGFPTVPGLDAVSQTPSGRMGE